MTKTAVVILNYNGEKFLQQFLPSVIQYSQEAEIIVADNGSSDRSLSVLKKQFPSVRTIELGNNYGFCGGYNRALKEVSATYYVLLNSDIEVTPHWLSPIISLLDQNTSVAAAQPKMLSFHEKDSFEYAGAGGGFIDTLGYPFCRGRVFDHLEKDHHQYDDNCEIFWATGACLVIRSEAYHRFGGLDEDFFAHMEEIDLCWKLHRANLKVMYCGASHVYHVGAGTLAYKSPRKTYLNFRNGLALIYKHMGTAELIWKLPLRLSLDWAASFLFLLKGEFVNSIAVLKAHLHFFRDVGKTNKKRRMLHNEYPDYSKSAVYPGFLVIDYYLKRKRVFSNPR